MTMKRSEILAANPISFNELLDLFERFLGTIEGPLVAANELIRWELNYVQGDIYSHTVGRIADAHDMMQQLKRIRAARNTGADVEIRLTDAEYRQLGRAISHTVDLLDDTAKALDLLVAGYESGGLDSAEPATASILRMISRTVKSTNAFEIPALLELESKVRKSASYVLDAETKPQTEVEA